MEWTKGNNWFSGYRYKVASKSWRIGKVTLKQDDIVEILGESSYNDEVCIASKKFKSAVYINREVLENHCIVL